jgi:hypothetical protein
VGSTVITEAGNDPKVKTLAYVAAFAPDAGPPVGDQVAVHPAPPGLSGLQDNGESHRRMRVESWIENVARDLPDSEALVLTAVQTPLRAATFNDKVTKAAWTDRPNWYAVSSEDCAISMELQRTLARRLNAHSTELASSHMSLLSQSHAVATVIIDAVAHVAPSAVPLEPKRSAA